MAELDLKHKTKVGLYWSFLNSGANQLMQFVVGIIMARLLTPSDFGITALPGVFCAIAGIFMDSGFGQALVRKKEVSEEDMATCYYYGVGMGFLMYFALFFGAPYIADFYNTPILVPLIRVSTIPMVIGPLIGPQGVILNRRLDFKTTARISIVNKFVSLIVGVVVAYAGYGIWALVSTGLTASFLGFIQTWYAVRWRPKAHWSKESFKYLWGYGNKMIGANIIDTLYNNLAPVVIGKFYTPAMLGVYNRAEGFARLPTNHICAMMQGVTFPILSRMQDDYERLAKNYRKMIKVSCFISFPVFFLLAGLARPLIVLLITEKWISCVVMLQIMCFAKMWWPLMSLNRNLLQVSNRTDLYLKMEVVKRFVNFVLMCIALYHSIMAFVCYQIVETIIALCFNTYYTGKLFNVGLFRQLRDVAPSYFLSALMLASVLGVNYFLENMWLQLFVGGFVGLAVYAAGAYILKLEELNEVKYMLDRKK